MYVCSCSHSHTRHHHKFKFCLTHSSSLKTQHLHKEIFDSSNPINAKIILTFWSLLLVRIRERTQDASIQKKTQKGMGQVLSEEFLLGYAHVCLFSSSQHVGTLTCNNKGLTTIDSYNLNNLKACARSGMFPKIPGRMLQSIYQFPVISMTNLILKHTFIRFKLK